MGFIGVFVVYVCQNMGLQYTSAAHGALIHGGIPIFTALIAVPGLRERVTWTRLIGIGASLAGVMVVVLMNAGSDLRSSLTGDTLVFGSGLALAAYFVLCRRAVPTGNPLALVAGVARYGFCFLFPASLIELLVVGMARPTRCQRTDDEQHHRRAKQHQHRTEREPIDRRTDQCRIGGNHGVAPVGWGSTYDVLSLTCSISFFTLGSMRSSIGFG